MDTWRIYVDVFTSVRLLCPLAQHVDPRQVDESVVRALRKYFPTEAKVLSDPRRDAMA
jgi:hypothetical protein